MNEVRRMSHARHAVTARKSRITKGPSTLGRMPVETEEEARELGIKKAKETAKRLKLHLSA
ncbi:MAG TPA: hypothetical protein G4O18_06465 [Dehalococcoidia bacterium]|nr:hypothetical protein [Dehalococcoidia bacterium]